MKRRKLYLIALFVSSLVLFISCLPKTVHTPSITPHNTASTFTVLPTQSPNYTATYIHSGMETLDVISTDIANEHATNVAIKTQMGDDLTGPLATEHYIFFSTPQISISKYFGLWEVVEYYHNENRSTPSPIFMEAVEKRLGTRIFLSDDVISDNAGYMLHSELCYSPEYFWVNPYVDDIQWFLMPYTHPESKYKVGMDLDDGYYFEVFCDGINQIDFEISATDRLVNFNSDGWYFLERVD